jgi:hypothetical protein
MAQGSSTAKVVCGVVDRRPEIRDLALAAKDGEGYASTWTGCGRGSKARGVSPTTDDGGGGGTAASCT